MRLLTVLRSAGVDAHEGFSKGVSYVHALDGFGAADRALDEGLPFSLALSGAEVFEAPQAHRLGQKIARAQFVLCDSHFAHSQTLLQADPSEWGKIHLVRRGLDMSQVTPSPLPDRSHLLCVADKSGSVSLRVLNAALQLVLGTTPDLTVALVGAQAFPLDEAALRDTLGEALSVLDADAAKSAMSGARAVVFPGFQEGLPDLGLQAMAVGRPMVVSQIAGASELVEAGVTGCVVPTGDVAGLAAAIGAVLGPEADAMGRAARVRAESLHDIQREAETLASLLNAAAQSA